MAKRPNKLVEARDKKMYERYKELYDIKRNRYDDVLKKLSEEFFILPGTIHTIILRRVRQKPEKEQKQP